MIKKWTGISWGVAFFILVISSPGCVPLIVGAAAGAGGYAWVSGELAKDFDVSARDLQAATFKALKDLGLTTREVKKDRLSAKITAMFADGSDANISIEALTERSARIKIRVSVFGNKEKSEMILNAVKKYL